MTKLISLTAAAALLMISGAVAQGYNSTSTSSSTKAQQSTSTSKSGASTASQSTSTSDKLTTKELNSAMTLDKVHDTAMLDTAKVEDRNGKVIGTV